MCPPFWASPLSPAHIQAQHSPSTDFAKIAYPVLKLIAFQWRGGGTGFIKETVRESKSTWEERRRTKMGKRKAQESLQAT